LILKIIHKGAPLALINLDVDGRILKDNSLKIIQIAVDKYAKTNPSWICEIID